jgi:hypothetical protein
MLAEQLRRNNNHPITMEITNTIGITKATNVIAGCAYFKRVLASRRSDHCCMEMRVGTLGRNKFDEPESSERGYTYSKI